MSNLHQIFLFFDSVLHPFQDYFTSYEMGQSVGGVKTGEHREKNMPTWHTRKQYLASLTCAPLWASDLNIETVQS